MKILRHIVVITTLFISSFTVFAADTQISVDTGASIGSGGISTTSTSTTDNSGNLDINTGLISESALGVKSDATTITSYKGKVGDYPEINCGTTEYFTQNSCDQCFDGSKKSIGEKITTLADSWTNLNTSEQISYKDEQILPEFINLGGNNTKWTTNPVDPNQFWKFTDEIIWTKSGTGQNAKEEFVIDGNKTVNFIESDFGASYSLDSTDKNEGEAIGLLKFFAVYHDVDNSGVESAKKTNTECVVYYSPTPTPAPAQPVTPQQTVQVKTGPEIYLLVLVALIIGFGFIRLRKGKNI